MIGAGCTYIIDQKEIKQLEISNVDKLLTKATTDGGGWVVARHRSSARTGLISRDDDNDGVADTEGPRWLRTVVELPTGEVETLKSVVSNIDYPVRSEVKDLGGASAGYERLIVEVEFYSDAPHFYVPVRPVVVAVPMFMGAFVVAFFAVWGMTGLKEPVTQ